MARRITVVGPRAVCIGTYRAQPIYRVPVRVHVHNRSDWLDDSYEEHAIIAPSAAAAANWAKANLVTAPQTTVTAYGPNGGKVERYTGWDTWIGDQLFARAVNQQHLSFE